VGEIDRTERTPLPELLELEPDDVHLAKRLGP
jgi:hypothetical protein